MRLQNYFCHNIASLLAASPQQISAALLARRLLSAAVRHILRAWHAADMATRDAGVMAVLAALDIITRVLARRVSAAVGRGMTVSAERALDSAGLIALFALADAIESVGANGIATALRERPTVDRTDPVVRRAGVLVRLAPHEAVVHSYARRSRAAFAHFLRALESTDILLWYTHSRSRGADVTRTVRRAYCSITALFGISIVAADRTL